ncbi:MAG: LPXTG cell wall anchor domain-containing protein [Lachnospiraceae bacterium]|nr:LPXTG cell wall anchor domain-containing protein [Lachnospiraceae bacterium]
MQKNRTQVVPVLLAVLMISTLVTGVMTANSFLALSSRTNVPTATLSIPAIPDSGSAATEMRYSSGGAGVTLLSASKSRSGSAVMMDSVIRDSKTVWSGETKIDIFSLSYDNAMGETTVKSSYGDKVIAPGTSDSYYFRIENTGSVSVDYTMTAEGDAVFTLNGVKYTVPVQVKLSNSDNTYLAGSANRWADVDDLDAVSDSGVLSAGHYTQYTLDWQWPYEQEDVENGDAFDTMLGDLAASGEELTVSVRFMVTASNDEDSDASGGSSSSGSSSNVMFANSPKTGDGSYAILWLVLMILSLCGFIFLLLGRRRKEDEE